MSGQAIDRGVAREAARWFIRLQASDASAELHQACDTWRAAAPEHERAWQLAEGFHARMQLIPSDIGRATLGKPASLDRRRAIKTLALLIASVPAVVLVQRSGTWQHWRADQRTASGEQREITLPDGTRLRLNTDSAVDIDYDTSQRRVRLVSGEIAIITAQDALGRPFRVETAQGAIVPIGTHFLVRQYDRHSDIAVLEGAVELTPIGSGTSVRLDAGQQASLGANGVATPSPLAPNAGDWLRGVLKAERMTLARFASELGRYRPGLLRCDPTVAQLQVSGAFQLTDTDLALQALTRVLPVKISYRTRYWITIAAADA
ncbi:FecR family protein [Pseudomonas solani]|uniref:FecR family protein n=1 Tax=Pseudomonas solani TaxID=2731552 RepID=A0AAU7XWG0_9PSED